MYDQFYNLTAEPFRMSPDHRFCYKHTQYAKAMAYMAYAFMRGEGFVLITGNPGTGKTTLVGNLIESIADKNVTVGNLVSTQLAADDLLRMVAFSFGIEVEGAEKSLVLQRLTTKFIDLCVEGGRALLIVDEAQDLSPAALEELRLLTNLQRDGNPLLQIFLLGQSELRDLVHSPGLEQVHQRIVAASHLEALKETEARAYVEHRLTSVGWENDPEISAAVYPVIFKFSEGVPRRINLFCSRLFLHACVERRHRICLEDAKVVVTELQEERLSTRNLLNDEMFFALDSFDGPLEGEREIPQARPDEVQAEVLPEEVLSVEKAQAKPESDSTAPAKRRAKTKSRAKVSAKSNSKSADVLEIEAESGLDSSEEFDAGSHSSVVRPVSEPKLRIVRDSDRREREVEAIPEPAPEPEPESPNVLVANTAAQVEPSPELYVAEGPVSESGTAKEAVLDEPVFEGRRDFVTPVRSESHPSSASVVSSSFFNLDTFVVWGAVITATLLVIYFME
jgi:general secretion pathway protein A